MSYCRIVVEEWPHPTTLDGVYSKNTTLVIIGRPDDDEVEHRGRYHSTLPDSWCPVGSGRGIILKDVYPLYQVF